MVKKHYLKTEYSVLLGDTATPIGTYLKVRDLFPKSVLLESSDYIASFNSRSYIGVNSIANFRVENGKVTTTFPDGHHAQKQITRKKQSIEELDAFIGAFHAESRTPDFLSNGVFGYCTYNAVETFEDIRFEKNRDDIDIPAMCYDLFEHVLVFDHFKEELHLLSYSWEGKEERVNHHDMKQLVLEGRQGEHVPYTFNLESEENSYVTDEEFMRMVEKGMEHCFRGDVFQVVLSRRYSRKFSGDEFNVYRQLRRINPSPYLFFFSYDGFKIFGSSPEAQLIVSKGIAEIHPIAGTFKRTGDTAVDEREAKRLERDPKENSEHVMLVDLARNDLSIRCSEVVVSSFKEVQNYSHVIHLTSKVTGRLKSMDDALMLLADTFPAGTLSGAPKVRAMQIIDALEKTSRSFYGGAVGIIGFDKTINKAIMIRTLISKNNKIYYQAGAGVVAKSDPHNEKEEVTNKLGALRRAIELAQGMKYENTYSR